MRVYRDHVGGDVINNLVIIEGFSQITTLLIASDFCPMVAQLIPDVNPLGSAVGFILNVPEVIKPPSQ